MADYEDFEDAPKPGTHSLNQDMNKRLDTQYKKVAHYQCKLNEATVELNRMIYMTFRTVDK